MAEKRRVNNFEVMFWQFLLPNIRANVFRLQFFKSFDLKSGGNRKLKYDYCHDFVLFGH